MKWSDLLHNVRRLIGLAERASPTPSGAAAGGRHRPFQVAQIEVTSRCFTGCIFCPQNELRSSWVQGDLPLDLYQECIVPSLKEFDLVYLQGWGEPMLHPQLWEMLALAKGQGCRTGFTTNGGLLGGQQAQRLVEGEVDLLSISLAGAGAHQHQAMRKNSQWDRLLANIQGLVDLKARAGAQSPWLELHFLMTRSNLHDLPEMVRLSARLGANEVAATNLTYSPTLALDEERVFGLSPLPEHLDILAEAQQAAAAAGIPLRVYPLQMEDQVLTCDARPDESIFINHQGECAPCVYLGLSVEGDIPRTFMGQAHPCLPVSFGNVRAGLEQALHSTTRRDFVKTFQRRDIARDPLAAFSALSGQVDVPPPPAPCRQCYKMYGV
jgi:MoaA/NifB/PqqE/SkfB family radical SAM enzyme